jgi:CelD/BcsL family acetyltransferase involved in cellulose biosynthesis
MAEWIIDEEGWKAIGSDWQNLFAESVERYPFLAYSIQRAWWQFRGGGEWRPDSELRILLDRNQGELRGIAPFFRTIDDSVPTYHLLGSLEIMDYLGVLYREAGLLEFRDSVCAELAALPRNECQRVIFSNLHPDSPFLAELEQTAQAHGWNTVRTELQECPVIHLPATWEEYLGTLDKKQRHEIRRKMRRAEAEYKLELRIASRADIQEDLNEFIQLMEQDPRKAGFLTPAMRNQFARLTEAAHQEGMLELAFLQVNGENAAAFYNFNFLDRTWVYNSGMNPKFASISPGWVLLAILIQRAIEQKQYAFDFMRGNEDYKFHWGGKAQKLVQVTFSRN